VLVRLIAGDDEWWSAMRSRDDAGDWAPAIRTLALSPRATMTGESTDLALFRPDR
jgi:hypothetical protein